MHLSRYLLTFPHPEQDDRVLLFSTRKTSLAQLPRAAFQGLQAGSIPADAVGTLLELGIITPDPEAEMAEVWETPAEINRLNPNLRVSVILGLACNFACQYCYEGTLKDGSAMDAATADALIAYLMDRFRPGKKRMILDFYGGETLLYTKMITYLASRLQPLVAARGGEFRMTTVTNGSLLTRECVAALLPYGLVSAKVTVDGPPENHNVNRPFKNGKPSFDVILHNLGEVADILPITLSGVYTPENWRSFPALLDILEQRGLTPDRFQLVKFDPVMRVRDQYAMPGYAGGCGSTSEPWLVEASLTLREEIRRRGYRYPELRPTACMVEVEDGFTVHCDGAIYKCTTLAGRQEFRAGDIRDGMADFGAVYNLEHWRREERCRECVYLPLCFGGCRFATLQQTGTMNGVDCQKEYLDRTLGAWLAQDIREPEHAR